MVGGIVVEVVHLADKVFLDLHDKKYDQTCAIFVEKNEDSMSIELGDSVWWQSKWAMWTTADKSRVDVQIPRIGYSGVKLKRD